MLPSMRALPLLLALALAVAAGCGGDDAEAERWGGLPEPLPADGTLPVDGFDEHAEDVDEDWERGAETTAAEFVRIDRSRAPETSVSVDRGPEGGGIVTGLVEEARLLDDSVQSRRYELVLEQREDGTWRVAAAEWSQRCRAGRGHVSFSPEPCV